MRRLLLTTLVMINVITGVRGFDIDFLPRFYDILPPRQSSKQVELKIRQSALGGFVSAPGDGHLYLDGILFDFRAFNTPTILDGSEFQCRDLLETIRGFGTPVTRTYSFRVANDMWEDGTVPESDGHIIGWDGQSDRWVLNENKLMQMDKVLQLSRQYGVKLIFPFINQDFGGPGADYAGNYNDLIRHRYNIWSYKIATSTIDWFTDKEMIRVFKQLLTQFLNRVNIYNGIRYGDDSTFLAFETGNEMNWPSPDKSQFRRPPPANWTLEIARHLKTLAPKTLVLDGSYSRNTALGMVWEKEVLKSKYVELFSYHMYGNGDVDDYKRLNDEARLYNKTLIIGEHGFYSDAKAYRKAYKAFTCAGSLVWSLNPHSERGGFLTHNEGKNFHAFHAPGWQLQTDQDFDTQEFTAIRTTYEASYRALGMEIPDYPIPGVPEPFITNNGTHTGLAWRGAAWAYRYEVFGAQTGDRMFSLVSDALQDNVASGQLFIPLDPQEPTKPLTPLNMIPKPEESHQGWIDSKWCALHFSRHCAQSDSHKPSTYRSNRRSAAGSWYSVRALSVDGRPGERSRAIYLKSSKKLKI